MWLKTAAAAASEQVEFVKCSDVYCLYVIRSHIERRKKTELNNPNKGKNNVDKIEWDLSEALATSMIWKKCVILHEVKQNHHKHWNNSKSVRLLMHQRHEYKARKEK